jgi:hypothetical protein
VNASHLFPVNRDLVTVGDGRVVGAARGQDLERAASYGADAAVDLTDDAAVDAALAAAAPWT